MARTEEQVNVNDISRITQGVTITGDIVSKTDIRIDGTVSGTLHSDGRVVIGETARLSGQLDCTNADFWGKMDGGDIKVKDTLSLKSPSVINGNIITHKLQVELGAKINGNIKMEPSAAAEPAAPVKK